MTNQTMRHMWCEKPGEIELRQRPIFEVGDNEVLVKIAYTGICPWDVRAAKLEGTEASARGSHEHTTIAKSNAKVYIDEEL